MEIRSRLVSIISTVFLGSILLSSAALARSTPVTVENTDSQPVPTKEAVIREPWQKAVTVHASYESADYGLDASGTQSVPVPVDKRLVIETITMSTSSYADLIQYPEYIATEIPELSIATTVAGDTVDYDFAVPEVFTARKCDDANCTNGSYNGVFFKAHINTRLYADPNTNVNATVSLRNRPYEDKATAKKVAGGIDFIVNMSGYLIPVDSASLSP